MTCPNNDVSVGLRVVDYSEIKGFKNMQIFTYVFCICIYTLQKPLLALRDADGGCCTGLLLWLAYGPFEGVKRAHSHYLVTKLVAIYDCLHKERVPILLAIAMWHHEWSTVGTG